MNRYDENFVGKIDDYIREFALKKFQIGCQSFLNQVINEENLFTSASLNNICFLL